jgi:acyl carrier protein
MVITFDEVCAKIRKTVRGRRAAELVIEEDSQLSDLGLSSLQIADLVYSLEDSLDIVLDPAQAANVHTVGDLVAMVNSVAESRT